MQILRNGSTKPDRIVFSHEGRFLGAGAPGSFQLWEPAASPYPLWAIRSDSLSRNFVFTSDGSSVIGGIGKVGLSDARTGAWREVPFPRLQSPIAYSRDGRFAIGYVSGTVPLQPLWAARLTPNGWADVWRKKQRRRSSKWGHRPVLFSVDGARVFQLRVRGLATESMLPLGIEVFDTEKGELLAEWTGTLPASVRTGTASASAALVLWEGTTIYIIDPTGHDSDPIERPNASSEPITDAALSRDCRLATTSNDTSATIWDTTTWEVRRRYVWQIGRLRTVAFAPDGLRCAAGSDTGQIVVWDLDD
jgi:WD40 repeat protein